MSPTLEPGALARIRDLQSPGESDLLAEMIDAFLGAAPAHLALVADALTRGDAVKLGDAAHALKSGAAYLGAQELHTVCVELEAHARSGLAAGTEALVAALQLAFEHVRCALVAERTNPAAAA